MSAMHIQTFHFRKLVIQKKVINRGILMVLYLSKYDILYHFSADTYISQSQLCLLALEECCPPLLCLKMEQHRSG